MELNLISFVSIEEKRREEDKEGRGEGQWPTYMKQTVKVRTHLYVLLQLNLELSAIFHL
jgi:hypothetical protein